MVASAGLRAAGFAHRLLDHATELHRDFQDPSIDVIEAWLEEAPGS